MCFGTHMNSAQDEVKLAFGRAVRRLRTKKGLSQQILALECGLDRTYIGSVERGERNVSLVNIIRIAQALGVPTATLLRDIDRPPRR